MTKTRMKTLHHWRKATCEGFHAAQIESGPTLAAVQTKLHCTTTFTVQRSAIFPVTARKFFFFLVYLLFITSESSHCIERHKGKLFFFYKLEVMPLLSVL